jgi:hypothetical protein
LPPDIEQLKQELEDTQEQLRIIAEKKKMYQMQVDRVLALPEISGNSVASGHSRNKGTEIG